MRGHPLSEPRFHCSAGTGHYYPRRVPDTLLKALIVGTGAALRRHPGDLARVGLLDVAGLAVHAVGGIDLQFLSALAVVDHFVDVGGTAIRAGIAEVRYAARRTHRGRAKEMV